MSTEPQFRRADGAAIRVWREAVQNNFLSEKHGRPIYDEAVMCEVITPGSSSSIPVYLLKRTFAAEAKTPEPALSANYAEYREYVEKFESGEAVHASMSGTPLSEWPEVSVSLAATLKASGVFTVDALANLPDEKLSIVGPDGRAYRTKAQAYLEKASGNADYTALRAELERKGDELAERDRQIAELNAKIDAATANTGAADPFAGMTVTETQPTTTTEAGKPAKGGKSAAPII